MQYDWSGANDGMFSKAFSGPMDVAAMSEAQYSQLLGLRNPYALPYSSPYGLVGSMQYEPGLPYYPMFSMGLSGLDGALIAHADLPIAEGVQSKKLYEFKLAGKSNKRYELKDIFDNIAEFAGDQHGSRFIQTKLETANSDEKERVFREIEPNAIPLMTDVFGNYVIQKFFDHGHQDHKRMLANKMRGQVLNLSTQMYGCRVVQKALEHVLIEQQTALVSELENHVLECVKNKDGNHVIQKAIERCPPDTIGFIYQAFVGQVQYLSLHAFGCRVIQRCLERQDWFPAKVRIMSELHESMGQGMVANDYGNYVVQHVVEKGTQMDRKHVFSIVIQGLESYSKHKFASNVVEKCIEYSDDSWRREV
ncbi:mRNA binding protein puf3, partial [Oleoguttula sp. CCFEE 5521]